MPSMRSVKANVIVTADLDMISDLFFDLRRKSSESMDAFSFDNVTFVLNCVDELVGDRSFIALRSRRPKHRTLTLVERQSRTFIEQAARDRKKAEEQAKKALEKAQTSLDEKVMQQVERRARRRTSRPSGSSWRRSR